MIPLEPTVYTADFVHPDLAVVASRRRDFERIATEQRLAASVRASRPPRSRRPRRALTTPAPAPARAAVTPCCA